jgi:hypothetical protein
MRDQGIRNISSERMLLDETLVFTNDLGITENEAVGGF